MIFFAVLVLATASVWAVTRGRDRRAAARCGLGIALAFAGLTHLVNPTPFEQHLPDWVPAPGLLVAASGVLEIALGIALAWVRTARRTVGLVTAAFLVAVFPANVYVAVANVEVDGQPGGAYAWIRLPFQALFVAWALWSTTERARTDDAVPTRGLLPPLPWTAGPAQERSASGGSTVMASVLVLRRLRDVPAFLAAAVELRSLFRRSPGAVRLSLLAIPARRTFWTLSQWESKEAIEAYARHPRHADVMKRFRARMHGSTFVTWDAPVGTAPTWAEAHRRVIEAGAEEPQPAAPTR